jgi:hypothetical protein
VLEVLAEYILVNVSFLPPYLRKCRKRFPSACRTASHLTNTFIACQNYAVEIKDIIS